VSEGRKALLESEPVSIPLARETPRNCGVSNAPRPSMTHHTASYKTFKTFKVLMVLVFV